VSRIVVSIAAAVLCACGATSGPVAPETPAPAAGFDVLITNKDQDVTVYPGQKVEVYLTEGAGMTVWSNLRSSDESVLAPVPTGTLAPRGVTLGGFQAVAAGTATITATAGAACSPGQACPMYAVLFSVRVTVV
jgi:hypothetical protein